MTLLLMFGDLWVVFGRRWRSIIKVCVTPSTTTSSTLQVNLFMRDVVECARE